MSKNDGGPAFPRVICNIVPTHGQVNEPGMSLRDWFAGMVLQVAPTIIKTTITSKPDGKGAVLCEAGCSNASYVAKVCYAIADAMIAQREEKP